jgi:CrcB protein
VRIDVSSYVAISVGAILGANARYLLGLYAVERLGAAFPYGTLFINVSGCLVIGFFLTVGYERLSLPPLVRLCFATGFLGAYTTFSTYAFETATLVRQGAYLPALAYFVASIAGGMVGVFLGIVLAEWL